MRIPTERLRKPITTLLVASAVLLNGCGGGGIGSDLVKSLSVTSSPSGNDVLVTVSTELNAGNLIFPAINLPIVDPKTPNSPYGTLILQRTLDGKNLLTVQVNVTRLSGSGGLLAPTLLPNGNPIPIAGAKDVIALQAGSSSRVYLGLNDKTKMLGVAVAIKEFDSIAQYVPGANLFFDIAQNSGINGVAGIFTGTTSGTSGFGLFIDATNALGKLNMAAIPNKVIGLNASKAVKSLSSQTVAVKSASRSEAIRFISGSNKSSWTTQRLQMRAYEMAQQRKKISVVNR